MGKSILDLQDDMGVPYLDVLQVDVNAEEMVITVDITLQQVWENLPVNRPGGMNAEYILTFALDADNNPSTGVKYNNFGADYSILTMYFPTGEPAELPFETVFHPGLYRSSGMASWEGLEGQSTAISIDSTTGIVTFNADLTGAIGPQISPTARYFLYIENDQGSVGFYREEVCYPGR